MQRSLAHSRRGPTGLAATRPWAAVLAAAVLAAATPASVLAGACPCGQSATKARTGADELWEALDQGVQRQRGAIAGWLAASDSAAARFVAGGRLWVGGPFPDFAAEACHRAGGLMPLRPLDQVGGAAADTLGAGDVVLLGFLRPAADEVPLARKLRERGALVVGLGAREAHAEAAAACSFWLDAGAPQLVAGAPAAGLLTLAQLWAFTGEFVAACVQRGQMPTIWQSIVMPGSAARNARYLPLRVHADQQPAPVPPGRMAAAYLDSLQLYLWQFNALEWERLGTAGRLVQAVRKIGRTAYFCPLGGHLVPPRLTVAVHALGLAELPRDIAPDSLRQLLRKGDVLYIQGYTEPPRELLQAARAVGAFTVLSLAGRGDEPPERTAADVVLDAQWKLGDAVVAMPGYDVPLLPPSGFMAGCIYWALVLAAAGPAP